MRKFKKKGGISIHAIAGTEVVLLGLNATKAAAEGLLGFSIYKRKGDSGKEVPLGGGKIFEGVHRENARVKSDKAPIQAFMWSDYQADPNTSYTYRVVPQYGEPGDLEPGEELSVTITTEDPEDHAHAVFFNRGVAGSQAYSRRFGKFRKWYKGKELYSDDYRWTEFLKPEDVPNRAAFKWLSRGLEEAILDFISQAKGEGYSIRAALYELTYRPVIQAFIDAIERGADVKIVHHCKQQTSYAVGSNKNATVTVDYSESETDGDSQPQQVKFKKKELRKERISDDIARAADAAVMEIGLSNLQNREAYDNMLLTRKKTTISHNKFIVLLKDGQPVEVWTGSTNLTGGGIFGQSNVGQIVRDQEVAQKYFDYWQQLSTDPDKRDMQEWVARNTPDIEGAPRPDSITPIFSPRPKPPTRDGKPTKKTMLDWYAESLARAKGSVHFTAAFTVANQIFEKVTKKKKISGDQPYLRYLLLEGIGGLMRKKYPAMKKCSQNRIAWGETLKSREGSEQLIETLTGLNDHVSYLHTKYLLIDPLTDDPIVITGSANFSDASTVNNDENMLVIRGNTRVADIFLGEFMRLFNHFRSRNVANRRSKEEAENSICLVPDDSWTIPYYDEKTQEYQERLLFSGNGLK